MASEIYVKLSEIDRPAKPVNDSDLVFIAQNESGVVESKAAAISDLRALLNFENAYTTTALGLAATVANQIFYVYTDSTQEYVKGYVNRSGVAEVIVDSDSNPITYRTFKGSKNLVSSNNVGWWLPATTDIFNLVGLPPETINTRGFYEANDNGGGEWKRTGVVNLARRGSHVITEGKVYTSTGVEYLISIKDNKIKPLSNGLKAVSYALSVDTSTDNFVCFGEAVNGILSQLPIPVATRNNVQTWTGYRTFKLEIPPDLYRIGKASTILWDGMEYDITGCTLNVVPGFSYTFEKTGKRLNGFEHGVAEIEKKWNAVGKQSFWGSVSIKEVVIRGGKIIGDQDILKSANQCTAGVGILLLNPEGVRIEGTIVRRFNWCFVAVPSQLTETVFKTVYNNAFDDNIKDYEYVTQYIVDAGVNSRFGNFYRVQTINCRFDTGRRGVYRNACDWTSMVNCEVINSFAWLDPAKNPSGDVPEFIMVVTGTGFECSSSYLGPAAAKNYNSSRAAIYTSARNHVFSACYTEWVYNIFMVSAYTFNGAANRLQGLHLLSVSVYKDDFDNYNQIVFENGCFGKMDDDGTYTYPVGFRHFDTPTGQSAYAIGTPMRDEGAFVHGGFDFKYGPYNTFMTGGTDWDSWRDRSWAREMFNPYGLQINSGTVFIPWKMPSIKSMVCIWVYDPTGKFSPRNIVAWITAASQEGSTNTDEALYKSFGEKVVDFGNGYKMYMVAQKRISAWDGIYSYGRNANIVFTVPSDTPIVIKAIEAYTGGVPLFPNGVSSYTPSSPLTSVITTVSNQVGLDGSIGGGLFFPGDVVDPWVHVYRRKSGYLVSPTTSAGYNLTKRFVNAGVTLETSLKVSFNATIAAIDNVKNITTIVIPTDKLAYIAMGIPLWVVSGSSTSTTGLVHLVKRLQDSTGKYTEKYLVNGVIGAVGDTLAINQSLVPGYTFMS